MLDLGEALALHIVFPEAAQEPATVAERANQHAGVPDLPAQLHLPGRVLRVPREVRFPQRFPLGRWDVKLPGNPVSRHADVRAVPDDFGVMTVRMVWIPLRALVSNTTIPSRIANPIQSRKQSASQIGVSITSAMIQNILGTLAREGNNAALGLFKVGIPKLQAGIGHEDCAVFVGYVLEVSTRSKRTTRGGHSPGFSGTHVKTGAPAAVWVQPSS